MCNSTVPPLSMIAEGGRHVVYFRQIEKSICLFFMQKKGDDYMSANVETMFYTREKPWHGLGTKVMEAPTSEDALILAGLNWNVVQQPICTNFGEMIPGYKANIRDSDGKVLGVVGERYQVLQNREAFAFTDELLGEGVKYETAGALKEGRQVWLLARLPREYYFWRKDITIPCIYKHI